MDNQAREFFAAEIDRLADRLFGTALRLTRNREDAEDLVAETVVKAWSKCHDVRDPKRFEGWIQRILSNTFMSEWRHRRASPIVALEANDDDSDDADDGDPFSLFEKLHQPFLLWWSNPEERAVTKLLNEDIERALDALPDAFRVAVVLVDVQGNSYAEAAGLLGVPVGTVRSRLARGRSTLQRALWQHACDAGFTNADLGRAEPQQSERTHRG